MALLNFIGLILSLIGAIILAVSLIISKKQALLVGVSRLAKDVNNDGDKSNVLLPHVQDELRESRYALIGIIILALGFVLQIVGSWPN